MPKPGQLWFNTNVKQYIFITDVFNDRAYFYWLDKPNFLDGKPVEYFQYAHSSFKFIS